MMISHALRYLPLLAMANFAALFQMGRAQELLQDKVLDSFRPVEGWRGVAEVGVVTDKTEITAGGEGRILINGTTKDTRVPSFHQGRVWRCAH